MLNERDLRVGNRRLTRFLREEVLGIPELSAAKENLAAVSHKLDGISMHLHNVRECPVIARINSEDVEVRVSVLSSTTSSEYKSFI